ncbi:4746_t:CDS:2, partial [Acaulospora colombiana]
QEKKLRKLAKKCGTVPENLPTILQNPDIVTLILKYLKGKDTDDEMPALLFDWNQAGFNDTNVPNCRNGVAGQTQGAIVANLLANGATDFMNLNILFVFQNGQAIGTWHKNVAVNLPWYEVILYLIYIDISLIHYPFLKGETSSWCSRYL